MVLLHGFDPCFPAYRAGALATRRQEEKWCVVGELNTGPLPCRGSARSAELTTRLVRAENFEISAFPV